MQLPYRVLSVLRRACVTPLFLLVACVAVFSAGCNTASYAPGPEFSPRTHDYLRLDDTAAFDACMATCSENSSLALVTRNGCFAGCEEARRSFPLHSKAFSSRQACLDALMQQELRKDILIREMRQWCDAQWTHVHNRRGCYTAAETFYANLAPAGMCGTDGAETAIYDMSLAQARERGAEDEPEQTPPPAPLAATETAQPAGSLIPPPYVPEETQQDSGSSPASPDARQPADTPPVIHDTPKYQNVSTSGSQRAKPVASPAPAPANTPAPQPEAVPTTPAPEALPAVPVSPAPQQAAPSPAPQAQSAAPAVPSAHPATPQSPPDQAALAAPQAPASPPPGSAVTAGQTTPSGEGSESTSPAGSQQTDSPVPAQEHSGRKPDLPDAGSPDPDATPADPMPGPPMPGLNANRPVPSSPEPADSPPIRLPVPSMLDRPYAIPPLLAPHIEVPE